MSRRSWSALFVACALFASCEQRTVQIEGLDELTAEIRSQRLLHRQQAAAVGGSAGGAVDAGRAVEVRGAQIHSAMAPLRDVLQQLGTSQRELSARQATLTQEMRRWTQLLVQSMHDERSDEATKLGERLADLEKTISEQDKRHRKVEDLLVSALDHTADQLEQFLKQVGAATGPASSGTERPGAGRTVTPKTGDAAAPNATSPKTNATSPKSGGQPTPAKTAGHGKNSAAPTTAPNTSGPNTVVGTPGSVGNDAPPAIENGSGGHQTAGSTQISGSEPKDSEGSKGRRQGSMAWLWGLAVMSLLSGFILLFTKKRSRPLAMAADMPYAPQPQRADDAQPTSPTFTDTNEACADLANDAQVIGDLDIGSLIVGELAVGDLTTGDLAIRDQVGNDPSNGSGEPDTPQVEKLWAAAALLGEAIGRLQQTDEPTPPELGEQPPLTGTHESLREQTEALPADTLPSHTGSDEFDLDDLFVIDEEDEADAAMFAEPAASPDQLQEPPQTHTPAERLMAITPPPQHLTMPPASPPASGQPAARHASSSPITCRLQLSGDEQAEGRVRSILGRDPRVLLSPAPQVRTGMGELEVSFALLPGLTAGERSQLEQQLRDTVA
ncbi:MAG: hypothetical protein ACI85K_001339 [Hyphomicrobiaceae bacterium]|jgi:hypothetical protein